MQDRVHSGLTPSIPAVDAATTLAQRLEAAEVGSRELDVSLAWFRWVEPKLWARTTHSGKTVWTVERGGKRVALPAYTTSLDAALALAERVLPGWTTDVHTADSESVTYPIRTDIVIYDDGTSEATLSYCHPKIDPRMVGGGYAATPALALCAAVLKAVSHGD